MFFEICSRLGEIAEIYRTFKYYESDVESDRMVYDLSMEIQVKFCSKLLKSGFHLIWGF